LAAESVRRPRAILPRAWERGGEAEQPFKDALERKGRMGARPWLAQTQEDYGRMLVARGDEERGRPLFEQALSSYRELGMEGALARATASVDRAMRSALLHE